MNTVTKKMKFLQSIIKCIENYGVTKAAIGFEADGNLLNIRHIAYTLYKSFPIVILKHIRNSTG